MAAQIEKLPHNSLIRKALPVIHYADCFKGHVIASKQVDITGCLQCLFKKWPWWIEALSSIRNVLVKPFGLKTEPDEMIDPKALTSKDLKPGSKINIFSVQYFIDEEIVLYMSDKHLDASLSIMFKKADSGYQIALSTVVQYHNLLGRLYFFFIKPFHIIIMKVNLKGMIKQFNTH